MKTKNRIDLIGFVGRDPQVSKKTDGQILNVRLSVATTDRWTDAAGEKKERTEWHRVVFWDRLAETVAKYVRQGSLLEVEGPMQSSTYEKDGVKHTAWQVRGSDFRLLDRVPGETPKPPDEPPDTVATVDDMPL
jgi:single-strand DNA-binding protein